ncbi:hypothetical protein N7453_011208 [Penicillium expansum]|nr:hypothetical protein N7453_011208 [Penicillium expansum]
MVRCPDSVHRFFHNSDIQSATTGWYAAVITSPSAVAFTHLRKSTTYFVFRNTRQKIRITTGSVIPGKKAS